jgi:DNA repair exonuclease SbcCD ATPase subunit
LREENTNTIKRLQKQMKDSGVKIKELEVMIESLMKEMQWKDEQISMLQNELKVLDEEYSRLFDAYQEQAQQLDVVTDELNSVYYAYGTIKELSDNGVIDKSKGFMGMGKKAYLKEDFNDKYFTRIDARSKKTISIEGSNMRFITNHPHASYTLQVEGARTKITIKDASEFWKLSKYLVVIVE